MMGHIKLGHDQRIVEDWLCDIIYTKGSSCDKCDFYPDEDTMTCPTWACRHYDSDQDRMIGGHLKKIKKLTPELIRSHYESMP